MGFWEFAYERFSCIRGYDLGVHCWAVTKISCADNTFSGKEIKQLGNSFAFCESYQAPGCKESQFYSLPFGQAVASMY